MQQPSSPPHQSRPTMSLTTCEYNPTFPHTPMHSALVVVSHARLSHHFCTVPGPCAANRNGPVTIVGVDYCTTCFQNTSHMTIIRRPKIWNENRKKTSNFAEQNSISPKNKFNILNSIPKNLGDCYHYCIISTGKQTDKVNVLKQYHRALYVCILRAGVQPTLDPYAEALSSCFR